KSVGLRRGICNNRTYGRLIFIELTEQMTGLGTHIRNFHHGARHKLTLNAQVVVSVIRYLERRITGGGETIRTVRYGRGSAREVVKLRVVDGCAMRQRRIDKGVLLPDAIQQAIIEDTEPATYDHLAVAAEIIGKADAWSEVGVVVWVHIRAE